MLHRAKRLAASFRCYLLKCVAFNADEILGFHTTEKAETSRESRELLDGYVPGTTGVTKARNMHHKVVKR